MANYTYNWRFRNPENTFTEFPNQRNVCYLLVEDNLFSNSLPFIVRGTYDKDADEWYSSFNGKLGSLSTSFHIVAWRYEEDDNQ